uniref:Transmembrane protein n=1 Tax=Marseillevirus LCMAC201 TaxID=2506605 RepID=A0A481YW15_9VIRU|nr:MAG: hypothetical protein LCMAC201_02980 [Marseillevirus LCMAC201]
MAVLGGGLMAGVGGIVILPIIIPAIVLTPIILPGLGLITLVHKVSEKPEENRE